MSIFHQHNWKVVSTDYTPPTQAKFELTGNPGLAEALINGTTHIYQKCETCGEIKQKDVTGKFVPQE